MVGQTGTERVRALIDGCGGPAKAAAATGILPNTIAEYLRIGEVTRTEHAVALCAAANWSVGLVGGLSGLPESGRVRPRAELGARWKRGARARDMTVGEDD